MCKNDDYSLQLKEKFENNLQQLDKLYAEEASKIRLLVLLKYIQYRYSYSLNDFCVPELSDVNDILFIRRYYQINVANFLFSKNDFTELLNFFSFVLNFSEKAKLLFLKSNDISKQSDFLYFLDQLSILNTECLSDRVLNVDYSINNKLSQSVTQIWSFFGLITFFNFIKNIGNFEFTLWYLKYISEEFISYCDITVHEIQNAILILRSVINMNNSTNF